MTSSSPHHNLRRKIEQAKSSGYSVIFVKTQKPRKALQKLCRNLDVNHSTTTDYVCLDETASVNHVKKLATRLRSLLEASNGMTELVNETMSNKELLKSKNIIVTRHTIYDNPNDEKLFRFQWSTHLSDKQRAYVDSLAVPPAWTPAHIFRENKKVLWVAKDKKDRWQWRYSDDWAIQQEFKKISDLEHMTPSFWKRFNTTLNRDMNQQTWNVRRLAAIASKVMYKSHLRPGWKDPSSSENQDDDDESHFGLITMQNKHYDPTKNEIKFVGKSGKCNISKLKGGNELAQHLRDLKAHGKDDDFLFEINDIKLTTSIFARYLKKLGIKPKQFRTHYANTALAKHLLKLNDHESVATRKKNLRMIYKKISKELNNTPKMTETSYVFSGFPTLYLDDPDAFLHIASKGLPSMIRYFKRVDWRDLSNQCNKPSSPEHIIVFIPQDVYNEHGTLFPETHIKEMSV